MFFPDPSVILCCVGSCSCGVCGYCLWRHREEIPAPSECRWIGLCLRKLGYHDHSAFDCLIEVHELNAIAGERGFGGGEFCIKIKAGRFEAKTNKAESSRGKVEFHEQLNLHVRQCERQLRVSALKEGVVGSEVFGECKILVKSDIIDVGFPKRQSYALLVDGKQTCKVNLSFHRLDTSHVSLGEYQLSPLLHQALLHAQYEAESRGDTLRIDFRNFSDLQKLRFFSKVLEGPLKKMGGIGAGWQPIYVKAVEKKSGKWEWRYWRSKEDCLAGIRKEGSYDFLAISVVLPDKYDRNTFYVKYHNMQGAHDLFFKRVDRDRNLWSDGLYEFIEKLREYLEKNPDGGAAKAFLEKKMKLEGASTRSKGEESALEKASGSEIPGTVSPRRKSNTVDLTGIKRMVSPRQTAATEAERPRIKDLKRRMVEGVMAEAVIDPDPDNDADHVTPSCEAPNADTQCARLNRSYASGADVANRGVTTGRIGGGAQSVNTNKA